MLTNEQKKQIDRWTKEAAKHEIVLDPQDFRLIDGDLYLDGMDPKDWIHAMTMD